LRRLLAVHVRGLLGVFHVQLGGVELQLGRLVLVVGYVEVVIDVAVVRLVRVDLGLRLVLLVLRRKNALLLLHR